MLLTSSYLASRVTEYQRKLGNFQKTEQINKKAFLNLRPFFFPTFNNLMVQLKCKLCSSIYLTADDTVFPLLIKFPSSGVLWIQRVQQDPAYPHELTDVAEVLRRRSKYGQKKRAALSLLCHRGNTFPASKQGHFLLFYNWCDPFFSPPLSQHLKSIIFKVTQQTLKKASAWSQWVLQWKSKGFPETQLTPSGVLSSSSVIPSLRGIWTCWSKARRGTQRWSEGWNTSLMKTDWESWGCSAWKTEGVRDTLSHLPVPQGATRRLKEVLFNKGKEW